MLGVKIKDLRVGDLVHTVIPAAKEVGVDKEAALTLYGVLYNTGDEDVITVNDLNGIDRYDAEWLLDSGLLELRDKRLENQRFRPMGIKGTDRTTELNVTSKANSLFAVALEYQKKWDSKCLHPSGCSCR